MGWLVAENFHSLSFNFFPNYRAGHVARMGEDRGVHRVLVGKTKGKRSLERPRLRWEDNINTLRTGDADLRF